MDRLELDLIFSELQLTQKSAADMLRVNERTVRRWIASPETMYGPAREALRAWVKCHRAGLDWGDVKGADSILSMMAVPHGLNDAFSSATPVVGDGVALHSTEHPDGLIEKLAEQIQHGQMSRLLKK